MYCSQCGNKIDIDGQYCSSCGSLTTTHGISSNEDSEMQNETRPRLKRKTTVLLNKFKNTIITLFLIFAVCFIALMTTQYYSFMKSDGSDAVTNNDQKENEIKEKVKKENVQKPKKLNPAETEAQNTFYQELIESKRQSYNRLMLYKLDESNLGVWLSDVYKMRIMFIPDDKSQAGNELLEEYRIETLTLFESIPLSASMVEGVVLGLVSPIYTESTVNILGRTYNLPPSDSTHGSLHSSGSIFIYQSSFDKERYRATLAHELGHLLARSFTTADWIKWTSLRGEKDSLGTLGTGWEKSVEEDFAEEFKKYVNDYKGDPNVWGNQTAWGESGYFYRVTNQIKQVVHPSEETITFIEDKLAERIEQQEF